MKMIEPLDLKIINLDTDYRVISHEELISPPSETQLPNRREYKAKHYMKLIIFPETEYDRVFQILNEVCGRATLDRNEDGTISAYCSLNGWPFYPTRINQFNNTEIQINGYWEGEEFFDSPTE